MRYYLLLVFFVCKSLFLQAQDSTQIIFKPDVQELLNAKVEVNQEQTISTGSFKTTALREAAGICVGHYFRYDKELRRKRYCRTFAFCSRY